MGLQAVNVDILIVCATLNKLPVNFPISSGPCQEQMLLQIMIGMELQIILSITGTKFNNL